MADFFLLLFLVFAFLLLVYVILTDFFGPLLAFFHESFNEKYGFPRNVKTGKEGLINKTAIVKTEFAKDPEKGFYKGKVFFNAELWNAVILIKNTCDLKVGDKVKIVGIDDLTLIIKAVS